MQSESNIRALAAGLRQCLAEPGQPDDHPTDRLITGSMLEAVLWCLGEPSPQHSELLNAMALCGAFGELQKKKKGAPNPRQK